MRQNGEEQIMKTMIQSVLLLSCLLASPFVFAWRNCRGSRRFQADFGLVSEFPREQQRVVHTCYETLPNFGVDNSTLESMIANAFKSWGDYIQTHKLTMGPDDSIIVSTIELRGNCQGNEDLTFYFGTENPQVVSGESEFEHPYGFAEYTGDLEGGYQSLWGKGFVWITNLDKGWSTYKPSLAGLILHEVGHVFGNGHEDGTVMTVDIGHYLELDTGYQNPEGMVKLYSSIDSQIELVSCPTCHTIYSAASVFDDMSDPILNPQGDWKASFQTLTGKVAVPPLSIQYERLGTSDGNGKLTVVDATGTYSFPVQIQTYLSTTDDSTPLFAGLAGTTFHTTSSHELANIKTLTGQTLTVDLQTNIKDRENDRETGHKVKIIVLDGKSTFPQVLFLSDDPN